MAIPAKKVAAAGVKPTAKTAIKPTPNKAEKEPKVKKPGVGDYVKTLIMQGKDNEKILEMVGIKFPEANTTSASVNWYRSSLRKAGEEVPSSRKPKAEKPAKAAPAKGAVAAKKPVAKKAASDEDDEGGFGGDDD